MPEDLWAWLEQYEADTGGEVIAIPHNPNLSSGEMFALTTMAGEPITAEWASLRSRFEPLTEVTQLKGDSESHPLLSPNDEFADFETWNSWSGYYDNWEGHTCCADRLLPEFDTAALKAQKAGEYARGALKRGLLIASKVGVNPYRFGMIGATDAHTSFSSADEQNFWGQYPNTAPSQSRITDRFSGGWARPLHWETNASGYAAVWAQENTRESLFAAMKRKEVYATTGPRIVVRVFAGWSFEDSDVYAPDLARVGYSSGVPMGGTLTGPGDGAPRFLIQASKDPTGANIDRVQVVKGWLSATGELMERVYDVAVSDNRRIRKGRANKPVKSTVDVELASYTNEHGEVQMTVVWEDPDFDQAESAFYYVRVLEIPTPRWPAYEARFFGIKDIPEEVVVVTQERAYTSPIWYEP